MRFKEMFNQIGMPLSNLGTGKFRLSLDKEHYKTPQYVMNKVLNILETRPHLSNGLKQITRFVLSDLKFSSQDQKSIDFMNEWFQQRDLQDDIFNFTYLLFGCGTSYFEPLKITKTNGERIIDNFITFPDPSIIYKNLSAKDNDEYWIVEVPLEVRKYGDKTPKFWPIHYLRGSVFYKRMVWGIPTSKNNFIQQTFGWSRTRDYGWGLLSSAIDNEDTTEEILKNWALIAKYRSLGKKILGFYNDNGESVDMSELDRIQEQFNMMEEEDSLLINKKFVSEDLSYNGSDNLMDQQVEFLRKDSGSTLTPNYMTSFSQDSSMATAAESKVPFALELQALQDTLQKLLNREIVEPLKKQYSFLSNDLELELAPAQLYSQNERFMNAAQLFNMRAATFNELRDSAGLPTVEGGDVWGEQPPLDRETKQVVRQEKLKFNNIMKEALQVKMVKESSVLTSDIKIGEPADSKTKLKEAVRGMLK